ncbi:MAG TPA: sugar phosphate isomerase/epimerase [Candidatus Acidoferrales bacterium]
MRLGIFAKTFEGKTPAVVLAAACNGGYSTVQYNLACSGLSSLPVTISAEVVAAVRAASVATGVTLSAVSATYNMVHPDAAERARGRASFAAIAGAARGMGTNLLTLCTGSCDPVDQWKYDPGNDTPAAWDEMCAEFRLLIAIAEREDVLLGVEPELANVVSSAARGKKLLDTFGDARIRIVFDPANLFDVASAEEQRALIEDALELLGGSIALAHAKDRLSDGRFAAAGAGVLDYDYYLRALKRVGFDGSLITHGLAAAEAEDVANFLKRKMIAAEVVDR